MYATSFDQANHVFDKPHNATYDECDPLSVYIGPLQDGTPIIISCWKFTKEELHEILLTGRIWCYHWGTGLQPHALSGTNPFSTEEPPTCS